MESQAIQLDARGLEPPQPMQKILEAVATLAAGATLVAHTDRQPLLLYPLLEQRGFTYETTAQLDGSHVTKIRQR